VDAFFATWIVEILCGGDSASNSSKEREKMFSLNEIEKQINEFLIKGTVRVFLRFDYHYCFFF